MDEGGFMGMKSKNEKNLNLVKYTPMIILVLTLLVTFFISRMQF